MPWEVFMLLCLCCKSGIGRRKEGKWGYEGWRGVVLILKSGVDQVLASVTKAG